MGHEKIFLQCVIRALPWSELMVVPYSQSISSNHWRRVL